MTDTIERAREVIAEALQHTAYDAGECENDVALRALEAITLANLAIIDTRTHHPVRVHTFDKDDPETWPKTELAPSGKPWLVCARVGWKSFFWHPVCGMEFDMEWFALGVTAYYDPADLTRQLDNSEN